MSLAALFVELLQNPEQLEAFRSDPKSFIDEIDDLPDEERTLLLQLDNREGLTNPNASLLSSMKETSAVYVLTYASHNQETDGTLHEATNNVIHRDGITTLKETELDLLAAHETIRIVASGTWDVNEGSICMTIKQPRKDKKSWITYELNREKCNNLSHKDGVTHLGKTRVYPVNEEAKVGKRYYLSGSMSANTGRVVLTFGIDKVQKGLQDDLIM